MKRSSITFLLLFLATAIENLDAMEPTVETSSEEGINHTNSFEAHRSVDPGIIAAEYQGVGNDEQLGNNVAVNLTPEPSPRAQNLTILDDSTNNQNNNKSVPIINDRTFNSQTMIAELKYYKDQLEENIALQYASIPAGLRAELELPCALALIDKQGSSQVGLNAMQLDTSWNVKYPSNTAKISAGFNALENLYSTKKGYSILIKTIFEKDTQTPFMSAKPSDYLAVLREKFPQAPELLLKTRVVQYLLDHKKYEQKEETDTVLGYIWNTRIIDDTTKPIKTNPSDIIQNPGWNGKNSTDDQKLYACIEALQNVYDGKSSTPAPSFLDTLPTAASAIGSAFSTKTSVQSAVVPEIDSNELYKNNEYFDDTNSDKTKTMSQVASDYLTTISTAASAIPGAVKASFNAAGQAILDSASDASTNQTKPAVEPGIDPTSDTSTNQAKPADVYSEDLHKEYFDDTNSDAQPPSIIDTISQVVSDPVAATQAAASGIYSGISAIPEAVSTGINAASQTVSDSFNAAGQAVSDSVQAAATELVTNAKNQLTAAGKQVIIDKIRKLIDENIKQATPEEKAQAEEVQTQYEKQGNELAQQPLLEMNASENSSEISSTTNTSQSKTSNIATYFADKFRNAAQAVKDHPDQVNFFIKGIITTFSWIASLSDKQTAMLQIEGEKQATTLINDNNSWMNADSITFDAKFNNWIQGFMARCYKLVGKSYPKDKDLKIVSIQDKTNNPLKPNITISYDAAGKNIKSVVIEYKNNSYKVDPENIKVNQDGSYTIDTGLFENVQQLTLFSDKIYNPLLKMVTSSIKNTSAGKSIGTNTINQIQDKILDQPAPKAYLSIKYNPITSGVITTTIECSGLYPKIITTKEYSHDSSQPTKQTITLPNKPGDLYSPDIEITSIPHGKAMTNSVTINHFDPLHNTTINESLTPIFNDATGTHEIVAQFPKQSVQSPFAEKREWVLSQFSDEQKPQVAKILDIFEPIISGYPTDMYYKIFNNLDAILENSSQATWSSATIASYIKPLLTTEMKTQYEEFKKYMLSDYPTSIQAIRLEYNLITGEIADRVVKRMAMGEPTETTLQYTAP